jgi:hypothetical protein
MGETPWPHPDATHIRRRDGYPPCARTDTRIHTAQVELRDGTGRDVGVICRISLKLEDGGNTGVNVLPTERPKTPVVLNRGQAAVVGVERRVDRALVVGDNSS